jgi:hypothetical protein
MGKRNYDSAARPGPRYQGEAEVAHGSRFLPRKPRKLRQTTNDTRVRLPYRSPHE